MFMRLLVELRVEDRHVAAHLSARELNEHHMAAGAPAPERDQFVPGAHVRDEVGSPEYSLAPSAGAIVCDHLCLGVELFSVLAVKAAWVFVRVIEEQVR